MGKMVSGVDVISLYLPLKTVSEKNNRDFYRKKAKRTHDQRSVVKLALDAELRARNVPFIFRHSSPIKLTKPVVVSLTRVAPSKGLDEEDNLPLSLSGVRDQVAECLGLANDRQPEWVSWKYFQVRGEPKEYAVQIDIRERLEKKIFPVSVQLHGEWKRPWDQAFTGIPALDYPQSNKTFLVWAETKEEAKNTAALYLGDTVNYVFTGDSK